MLLLLLMMRLNVFILLIKQMFVSDFKILTREAEVSCLIAESELK
jgi:hypothetical protein